MKKLTLAFAMLFVITFFGCAKPKAWPITASTPISSKTQGIAQAKEKFYPYDGSALAGNSFRWLYNGTILAIPDKKPFGILMLKMSLNIQLNCLSRQVLAMPYRITAFLCLAPQKHQIQKAKCK